MKKSIDRVLNWKVFYLAIKSKKHSELGKGVKVALLLFNLTGYFIFTLIGVWLISFLRTGSTAFFVRMHRSEFTFVESFLIGGMFGGIILTFPVAVFVDFKERFQKWRLKSRATS